jgi:hypothetical protein
MVVTEGRALLEDGDQVDARESPDTGTAITARSPPASSPELRAEPALARKKQ